ncbi:hypothetical protein OG21DRAFT_1518144 [Imleria badia]|nr:hypothetical protein OG21DRAFT_1518144 [Imleria badia]
MDDDFDFDRTASAFPDIFLDRQGDLTSFPTAPAPPAAFSSDDFGSPPRQTFQDVKVTSEDEIEKFEDQFPELYVSHTVSPPPPSQPTFGATPPFALRPQPSAFSSTPILNQQISEDEPGVIRE